MNQILEFDTHGLVRSVGVVISELNDSIAPQLEKAAEVCAESARKEHRYQDRSGNLTRSIKAFEAFGQFFARNLTAEVWADVPYAASIEAGSKPHTIRAKGGGVLRFTGSDGRIVFRRSVRHPGTQPYRFLEEAAERSMDEMTDLVLEGALDAFERAGFDVRR